MPATQTVPLGLHVNQAARVIAQAFDAALVEAGGSLPVWLVLLNLKIGRLGKQGDLAAAVGIREATLTHHLNGMERDGLLTRTRSETNRRVHVVALTEAGDALFLRLAQAAGQFDGRLTRGLSADARRQLADGLEHLVANLGGKTVPPWADQSSKGDVAPTPSRTERKQS
jgi:MarR family transcriptional regulator for hemolysin